MRKEDKALIIEKLGQTLKDFPHFYLVDVTGMNAARTSAMRRQCFKSEVKMVVVKNTLLHKAFEASDIDYSPIYDTLKGTTAVIFSNVANAPAKMLKDFNAKNPKGVTIPELKAAYAEESFYVGADQLDALVAIKSKNELIADVVAMLQSPMQGVLSAIESGAATIHGVLETLAEKGE
ncbi:MAG: 50S ribosomal protein L10 [Bacteroidaceae bacterium]|jgi:large subunit ribosomal protein L10|nr:50S ribosomal protein L10 [Bacteroidaceae bacterium]